MAFLHTIVLKHYSEDNALDGIWYALEEEIKNADTSLMSLLGGDSHKLLNGYDFYCRFVV